MIRQVNLGPIPMSYVSSIKPVSRKKLDDFVRTEIKEGVQIVSLPVPPYRHAILVDVQPHKIMVSDWNGQKHYVSQLPQDEKRWYSEDAWAQYGHLLWLISQKYQRPVAFYAVDREIHAMASRQDKLFGGGGCSLYIFTWVSKHPDYRDYTV